MATSGPRLKNTVVRMRSAFLGLLALVLVETTWGRGGGGCLEQGTPILTPTGNVPIELLRAGDAVLTVHNGRLRQAIVQGRIQIQPAEYLELTAGGRKLRVTAEHLFAVGRGEFCVASHLQSGDPLQRWEEGELHQAQLQSAHRMKAERPAYNLLVAPFGTYLAGGLLVHNKGCFLPDTPVLLADGSSTNIASLRKGDPLLAFETDGSFVRTEVREVFTHHVEEFFIVATEHRVLRVTAEHPFYVGESRFKTLNTLRVGDTVFACDGAGLTAQRITGLERVRSRTRVYNVQTDEPHTFFANGVAVHNKGGCFPAGTPVRTPRGEAAIETLQPGDAVLAVDEDGAVVRSRVEEIYATRSTLLILGTDAGELRTTSGHPLLMADGTFRDAGYSLPGDRVVTLPKRHLRSATIRERVNLEEPTAVFNLRVGSPHTFIASGFVVHNKGGGCFPAGTKVATPGGERLIEQLLPGDDVLAVSGRHQVVTTTVRKIFTGRSPLTELHTDFGILRTTAEHPLRLSRGGFRMANELDPGDEVRVRQHNQMRAAKVILRRSEPAEVEVFNLEVDAPHTFIADGFVVHNKGGGFSGGGYRGGGRSSSSGKPGEAATVFSIFCALFVLILVFWAIINRQRQSENLDFLFSRGAIAPKLNKTLKLLEFIAKVDPALTPTELEKVAESTFVQLQKCWQARKYEPMKPLLMPDLYANHVAQLAGMIRNGEINVIAFLEVKKIDLVNVRYTHSENEREFTALITAQAKDYYINDRTKEFLRGDDSPATFQEFWTFQFAEGSWRLREIEQTRESDALKDENFFEQFTDDAVAQVYGETAGKEGEIGPWLEKETATKATRIERLLNFLVRTDRMWNRRLMQERARQVFTRVFLAWERGDPVAIPTVDLLPEYATQLSEGIRRQKTDGITVEYRNFCVRKVELILVRNFADNTRDEFTVRIGAHAQYIVKQHGQVIQQDEYVSPFVEYWTFGRRDGLWKLKEVLAPAEGEKSLSLENVDEESSQEQVQWYYQKTRAG
jgi:predicted lipid-binding transport protein (Tim44 family)/3-dehydroquinate synthase class II